MAEEDYKAVIAKKVTESVPLLLVLLGSVFVVLGLSGGITYQQWLPIQDVAARVISGVLGGVLIVFGAFRSHTTKGATLDPHGFGVKIQYPAAGSHVNTVNVGGAIEKDLPPGYCLRVFRVYPGSNSFAPLSKARIDIRKKTWVAERCHIGGKTNDQRSFAAYICGPSAEVLINFHNEAVSVHRKTMEQFEKATGKEAEFLPSIAARTEDMFECDRVAVVRS